MKNDFFKNIEQKLGPDDSLTAKVLLRAEKISTEKETGPLLTKGEDTMKNEAANYNTENSGKAAVKGRYGLILTSAAALMLIIGGIAIFRSGGTDDENIQAGSAETKVTTNALVYTEDIRTEETEEDIAVETEEAAENTENEETVESRAAKETETEETENSEAYIETEKEAETDPDDGEIEQTSPPFESAQEYFEERANWRPDEGTDFFVDSEDYQPAADENGAVIAIDRVSVTDEFRSFQLGSNTYRLVSFDKNTPYNELANERRLSSHIPNSSYISEYQGEVSMPSIYGVSPEDKIANAYALKFIDTEYLLAVQYQEGGPYYLFANEDYEADNFETLMASINLNAVIFDGESISRRAENYAAREDYAVIDNSAQLNELILALHGDKADAPEGDMAWQTFIDAPLYGGSLSFKWYADGYVTVKAFYKETTYYVGAEAVRDIIGYINANSHSC